jgi:hypothetical protein
MIINIGGRSLCEWYTQGIIGEELWSRDDIYHNTYGIDIAYNEIEDYYSVSFYGGICSKISDMYSGPRRFNDLNKAKDTIDEFILRLSKLRVFW